MVSKRGRVAEAAGGRGERRPVVRCWSSTQAAGRALVVAAEGARRARRPQRRRGRWRSIESWGRGWDSDWKDGVVRRNRKHTVDLAGRGFNFLFMGLHVACSVVDC